MLMLQDAALHDEYFTSRKLYPNVDYYRCAFMGATTNAADN
jgi:citrate synthase